MTSREYFADILKTEPVTFGNLITLLEAKSGKVGVLDALQETNERKINDVSGALGVGDASSAEEVRRALMAHVEKSETALLGALEGAGVSLEFEEMCGTFCSSAAAISGNHAGYFLKVERAHAILEAYPPPNILKYFGYKDTQELLAREDIFEVWSALRFVESREWMNDTFVHAYANLTPDDFEERSIRLFVLPKKWLEAAAAYVKKKFHNVSHLKEMGVIFIEPIEDDAKGVNLRIFLLLLHYLHEVPFYSQLFRHAAKTPEFSRKLMSYIRGDVREYDGKTMASRVPIIQRYLAKEDPKDKRLYAPHVNPEAIHWRKAENDLAKFAEHMKESPLKIWHDLDWIGKRYGDELVVFNLIDSVMSLIPVAGASGGVPVEVKYRYHHQEALWNKIFFEYLGEGDIEEGIVEHLERGYLEI